jgi:hypothetical protein
VSVYLFDDDSNAERFCNYLNGLEPDKESFFYARYAEQMVEYETEKQLLAELDKIYEISRHYGDFNFTLIINEALNKFSTETLSQALFGLDKNTRMFILQNLPVKTRDEVNENLDNYNKSSNCPMNFKYSRKAQEKMMVAINRTYNKFKQGKLPGMLQVLMD